MSILAALAGIAGTVCAGFLIEGRYHRRQLDRIPIRIHVNGTRGKSSVARLIAAGLRGGGRRVCAKTTGTMARMIFPNGRELPIFRPARANVIEQKRIIRAAVNANADALVIECMALQPLLQSVCELQLVRSTHGVITNCRADHLDVMGPTRLDVARALSGTVPVDGQLFSAEHQPDSIQIIREAAADRGTELTVIQDEDRVSVTEEELAHFSYIEHAENVALALSVCQSVGVSRQNALHEMWRAKPDPGAMKVHELMVDECQWSFVNGFAANDPESTAQLWKTACERFGESRRRVLIMNCRVDRPDRSATMGDAIGSWSSVDQIVVVGTGTDAFLRPAVAAGVCPDKLMCLGTSSCQEIADAIADAQTLPRDPPKSSSDVLLMGIGNVAGPGWDLDHFFRTTTAMTTKMARSRRAHAARQKTRSAQRTLTGAS